MEVGRLRTRARRGRGDVTPTCSLVSFRSHSTECWGTAAAEGCQLSSVDWVGLLGPREICLPRRMDTAVPIRNRYRTLEQTGIGQGAAPGSVAAAAW